MHKGSTKPNSALTNFDLAFGLLLLAALAIVRSCGLSVMSRHSDAQAHSRWQGVEGGGQA